MPPPLEKTLNDWVHLIMMRSMRHFMRFAKARNYSLAQLNALMRLHYKGRCAVTDLGEESGVTRAAVSQLLEKMVQQGWVTRTEDPNDRRHKVVMLTPIGEQIVHESINARQAWLAQLVNLLSPEEQAQVDAALQLLIQKAASLEEPQP